MCKMKKVIVAALAGLATSTATSESLVNYVVNGSFEEGYGSSGCVRYLSGGSSAIPGWTVVGGSFCVDWVDGECGSNPPVDGSRYHLDLKGSLCSSCNNNGGVRQVAIVPEVGLYTLVVDLSATSSPNDSAIVSLDGNETELFGSTSKSVWESRAIPFAASATEIEIYIYSPNDHTGVSRPGLDNVRLFNGDCNNDGIPDLEQIEQGILEDADGSFVPDCCEDGVPCSPPDPVENLVANGSFEEGYGSSGCVRYLSGGSSAIPGWTVVGGSFCVDWVDGECGSNPPVDGSRYHLDLKGSLCSSCNNNGGVRQVAIVPEVGLYTLVVDLSATSSPNDSAIVSLDGNETELFGSTSKSVWESRAIPFAASATEIEIYIYSPNDHTGVSRPGLDNVRLFNGDCNNDGIPDLEQIEQGILEDADGSFVPDICEPDCSGDLSKDGIVDATDLGLLIAAWNTDGTVVPGSDLNGDGLVNSADLGLLIGAWGLCP